MAYIAKDRGDRRRIQFTMPDGKRANVAVGRATAREASAICEHIEHLVECLRYNRPVCLQTHAWAAELQTDQSRRWLYDRLARVGLVLARQDEPEPEQETRADPEPSPAATPLGRFLREYIEGRTDLKDSTIRSLEQVENRLVERFGYDRAIGDISPYDGDCWRVWLSGVVGDNTTRRHCGRAKQFFRAAVRKRLIPENPFADMKDCNVQPNRKRDFFVNRGISAKVMNACPDAEWRLIFALSRFGGLRCPSEHLAGTWADIDFDRGLVTVHAPKTERHIGHETRVCPMFPELRHFLVDAFNEAESRLGRPPSGADFLITRYRDTNSNLRTQLQRIIKRAGVKEWPRLFQNLRASRATELADRFPSHVCAAWLGHSVKIADAHYRQVTEEHYLKAIGQTSGTSDSCAVECVHSGSTQGDSSSNAACIDSEKPQENRGFLELEVAGAGLERSRNSPGKNAHRQQGVGLRGSLRGSEVESWLSSCPVQLTDEQRETILSILSASVD